jgi:uncharacterized membrane protein
MSRQDPSPVGDQSPTAPSPSDVPPSDVPPSDVPPSDVPQSDVPASLVRSGDDIADPSGSALETAPKADLWAFAFRDPALSQEALMAALRLTAHGHLELDDAVIVTKDERGKVRLIQTRETTPFQAALSGSWVGLFAGLFVPGGPLIPMALGAAAGGLFAKLRDRGINDDEMRSWGEQLDPGSAALFLLVEDCHQARALHEVARFEATVLTSTAPPDLVATVAERLAVNPWDL